MKTVTLGEVANIGSGGTPKRSIGKYFGPGTPWVSIADLNDGVISDAKESLTLEGLANSTAKVVPAGTLLVAMYGSIGKLGVAGVELCTSQAIATIQPDESVLDQRYLFHYLLEQRPSLQALGRGGTQMNIGQGDLKRWTIPLPPLDEQERVAAILDRTDTLRHQRNQVINHLSHIAQALFESAFSDEMQKATTTLNDLTEVVSGITKGRKTAEATRAIPYLAVANVQAGRLDLRHIKEIEATESEIKRYALKDGDIVLTEGGDPDKLGRGTVWRSELPLCLHQNHIFRVRVMDDQLDPDYLSAYLASKPAKNYFLRAAKQTTGIASINMTQLRATPVYVPPTSEQQQYLRRVRKVTALRHSAEAGATTLAGLFTSLQSRAFAGQL